MIFFCACVSYEILPVYHFALRHTLEKFDSVSCFKKDFKSSDSVTFSWQFDAIFKRGRPLTLYFEKCLLAPLEKEEILDGKHYSSSNFIKSKDDH